MEPQLSSQADILVGPLGISAFEIPSGDLKIQFVVSFLKS